MAKLKVCAALAAAAVLLGAGGLAYRAAAQERRGPAKSADVRLERGAGGRALSELELLRKEVDILKLQVEVLQDKVRALQGQPAAGGPKAGLGMPGMPGMGGMPGMPGMAGAGAPGMPGMPAMGRMPGMPGPGGPAAGGLNRSEPGPGGKMSGSGDGRAAGTPDAVSEVEAALKALRQARDPEARRRATDALEKAVKQLRGQPAKPPVPDQPAQR
jgi:hypothetical protein